MKKQSTKQVKNKIVNYIKIIMILLLNIYLIYQSYCYSIHKDSLYFLQATQQISIFIFIFFIFISYEKLSYFKRKNIEELIFYNYKAKSKFYLSNIYSLLITAIIIFANILIFNIVIYYISNVNFNKFLYHILENNILNILFTSVLAIFIGIVISFIDKRIKAYTLFILIIFLVSPVMEYISFPLIQIYNLDIYNFTDYFQILIPDTNYVAEWLYGLSIDSKRWLIVCMWTCICIFIFINKISNKKNIIFKGCFISLIIFMGVIGISIINSGERLCLDYRTTAFAKYDQRYYQLEKDYKEVNEKNADFSIDKYNMNLKINKELNAEVEVYLTSEKKIDIYDFTLYRSYEIESIVDKDGNELEYIRNGDYFSVINNRNENIEYIKIKYSGFAPSYYSNKEAAYLPAYFPYYPIEGCIRIFNSLNIYESERNLEKKQFDVNVESNLELYSNLDKSENRFTGISEGLTLIGGLVEEVKLDGVDIIKSPLNNNLNNINYDYLNELQKAFDEISWIFGDGVTPQILNKKIIQIPELNSVYTKFIETSYSDHLFLYFNDDPKNIIRGYFWCSDLGGEGKENTRELFLWYIDNILYESNDINEYLCEDKEFENLVKEKEKLYDKKEFISIIYGYLKGKNNMQNEIQFFNSL